MNALSIGDGFKFGCGFMLAALVAWLAIMIVGTIVSLILTAILGVSIGTLLSGMQELSWFLPALIGLI